MKPKTVIKRIAGELKAVRACKDPRKQRQVVRFRKLLSKLEGVA